MKPTGRIREKIETIAREIYGADGVALTAQAEKQLREIEALGQSNLPVCMAKTQYSLSDNPALLGRPSGFIITVKQLSLSAGAGFIVALTGDIMTMPGRPKRQPPIRSTWMQMATSPDYFNGKIFALSLF